MSRSPLAVVLVAGAAGALAACVPQQSGAPPQTTPPAQPALSASAAPAAAPAATAATPLAAPAAPAAGPAAIASGQYSADPALRCDVLEVKRVSGGALRAQWRIVNTSAKPIYYDFSWGDIYFIDPAENKKYAFLTDTEGNRIIDVFYGSVPPGEQRLSWAKFPAPPPTSTTISLNVPKFAPFEDVPIAQ